MEDLAGHIPGLADPTKCGLRRSSRPRRQACPAELPAWIRGYRRIEALRHIRDSTYYGDHSPIRTGDLQVMASVRNLTIGILKLGGHDSIAAARRHRARDATRALATLGLRPGRG